MLATIRSIENGEAYEARFERVWGHSVASVWAMLTENEQLAKWFPEMSVADLRVGGAFKFDMGGGNAERMEIVALEPLTVLAYTWAEDRVRFELAETPEGCRLALVERIARITDHTPRDLAGWHVCLDVIAALLDGRTVESRKADWEKEYEAYKGLVERVRAGMSE
ncbi:SRPBCC family protein [Cohnella rhizosphaerae]|uniref:SRPBCC family protein n=2 Tax=Cohnella rhizosphaerae TaxID=1457232 RepID=A0A9X4L037_9BACL|nr:SRPBCC family protein [Cohnella rhizosphaerae]MDG0811104.1 SRPBCC family protein [Cohnella rhizosphaerae]